MSTGNIQGRNFALIGGITIRFFDFKANHGDGKRWRISFFTSEPESAIDPTDLLSVLRRIIAGDVANGRGNDVAMVLVNPDSAACLFLEGVITPDHLPQAQEPTVDMVDIPGVAIDDRTLTVRVLRDPAHRIATADAQGQLIQ